MSGYHLNWEGRIYRCRAKVRPCPYGADFHADRKEELYHKIAKEAGRNVGVMDEVVKRMDKGDQIGGIWDISQYIASTEPAPLEVSIATLEYVIERTTEEYERAVANGTENDTPRAVTTLVGHWSAKAEECIEYLAMACATFTPNLESSSFEDYYERTIDNDPYGAVGYPAQELVSEAMSRASYGDKYKNIGGYTSYYIEQAKLVAIEAGTDFADAYTEGRVSSVKSISFRYFGLSPTKNDFNKLSAALNTSKIISSTPMPSNRPLEETIANMSNDELVTLYEDSSTYDGEVQMLVEECDYFMYTPDDRCSRNYNNQVGKWYERNRQAWKRYVLDSPRRITMSMLIADELTKRGINYGDTHRKQAMNTGLISNIESAIAGIEDKPRW